MSNIIKFQQGIYQNPTHFDVVDVTGNTKAITTNFGTVIQVGTPYSPENFNEITRQISYTVEDAGVVANVYSGSLTNFTIDDLKNNLKIFLVPNNSNTGASTITIEGVGPVDIKKQGNVVLEQGDILQNQNALLSYSETFSAFELNNPFSFKTDITTNATNITALERTKTYLSLSEIGISDSSLSTVDFGANVLTILNALPESTTFDDFSSGNLGQSMDNVLSLSVGSYRLTINSSSNDNNIPNTIQIIPNNTNDFYIGTYDNSFLGMEKIPNASDLNAKVDIAGDTMTGELIVPTIRVSSNAPVMRFEELDNAKDYFLVVDSNDFSLREDNTGTTPYPLKWTASTQQLTTLDKRILTTDDHTILTGNITYTDSIPASTTINKDIAIGSGFRKGKLVMQRNIVDDLGIIIHFDTDSTHTYMTGFSANTTSGSSQARAFVGSVTAIGGIGSATTGVNVIIATEVFITGTVLRITLQNTDTNPVSLNTRIDWTVEK